MAWADSAQFNGVPCCREVPYEEIDEDHYLTVSPNGVVLRKNDLTEFYSLTQWQKEYLVYKHITSIKTFYQFRLWKAFSIWRCNVIRR